MSTSGHPERKADHRAPHIVRDGPKPGITGEGKKERHMTYSDWADKLETIESYLKTLFPQCLIEKIEDPLRCQLFRKHMYRIEDRDRGIEHLFKAKCEQYPRGPWEKRSHNDR